MVPMRRRLIAVAAIAALALLGAACEVDPDAGFVDDEPLDQLDLPEPEDD
jgi:hypothetical protein